MKSSWPGPSSGKVSKGLTGSGGKKRTSSSRRDFLSFTLWSIGAFISTVLGIPVLGYLLSPALKRTSAEWTQLGPLQDFTIGLPQQVAFTRFRRDGWIERPENLAVWVLRVSEAEVVVYNGHCTHLGCAFSWVTEGKHQDHFFCPCHDGVYARDGTVLGGPPPRPLDPLETKVEVGVVYTLYQDFRPGLPEQESM